MLLIHSVQFGDSVMSDSLWPHESQHTRPPCPSPTPRVHPNPCPSSRWCHPAISSSVIPFSSCLQSFPPSGSFQMSHLFTLGGQSIAVSASASVLPKNIQDWYPLEWIGWISLQSKGLSKVFSNTTVQKHQFFSTQLSLYSNSHIRTWALEKPVLTRRTFVGKIMSLLYNMLSRLVITFLPRSKRLLISWGQSPSAVILVTIPILKLSRSPRNIVLEWKRILSCITRNSKILVSLFHKSRTKPKYLSMTSYHGMKHRNKLKKHSHQTPRYKNCHLWDEKYKVN